MLLRGIWIGFPNHICLPFPNSLGEVIPYSFSQSSQPEGGRPAQFCSERNQPGSWLVPADLKDRDLRSRLGHGICYPVGGSGTFLPIRKLLKDRYICLGQT